MATEVFKKCKAIGVKLGMKNLDMVEDKIRDINSKFESPRNYENDGFRDPNMQEKTNMKTYVLMKKGDQFLKQNMFKEAIEQFKLVIQSAEPEDDFESLS